MEGSNTCFLEYLSDAQPRIGWVNTPTTWAPDKNIPAIRVPFPRPPSKGSEIRYKGKSIADVLDMNINQALIFFENHPKIIRQINALAEVGLGYIKLGQQSTTLSGGESQRVKLASELSKKSTGNTFYILDEPTTGLHFEDVNVLLQVLEQLVNKGNTVLVIEHNLDVIKMADHIIEIGPDGGSNGGKIINTGTPEEIILSKEGYTASFLKEELNY